MKRSRLTTRKPLTPRTREELKAREAERGKRYKRLHPRSDKRAARHKLQREQRAAFVAEHGEAVAPVEDFEREVREVYAGPRAVGEQIAKAVPFVDDGLLEAVRRSRCRHCGAAPPVDPHHWPTTGALGVRDDRLAIALCRRSHDAAHDGKIAEEDLFDWAGEQMAVHIRAGRLTLESALQAASNIEKKWHRARVEGALYEAMRSFAPRETA